MKVRLSFLLSACLLLAACATEKPKEPPAPAPNLVPVPPADNRAQQPGLEGPAPAMTIDKAGKKLSLVRVMDGAACKSPLEGAKGTFLVYADLNDIERIKKQQGPKVFREFELKIQTFSEAVLQEALDNTNLADNPFALGQDEAYQQLATQLSENFQQAANAAIAKFEQETSLTINVTPFAPSLVFFRDGCQAVLDEPEDTGTKPPANRSSL